MDYRSALKQHFGHDSFRPQQEAVVAALCAGHSAFALLPTGAGKSICYQLPALLLPGTTLVISPLIALMQDQVNALKKRGIAAARVDSTLTKEEIGEVLGKFRRGELKLLYLAPERLLNAAFLDVLRVASISMVAVDEAHCISEWGHHFRPDYLRIAKVVEQYDLGPVLALTATATPQTATAIQQGFQIKPEHCYSTSFHRPNLHLHTRALADEKRLPYLCQLLRAKERRPAIVYVTLQETAERVATHLAARRLKAKAYHAGLADEHRSEAQESFMRGKTDVMVATIAFGMGIDKANVRSVVHYNLPKSLENYQQEIGRAGRDGDAAHCEMLACGDDRTVLENFIHGDRPSEGAVRRLLDFLLRQGSPVHISPYQLASVYDIRTGVLETILTLLELRGIFTFQTRFYETWDIGLLRPLASILSGRDLAERLMIQRLLAIAEPRPYGKYRLSLTLAAEEMEQTVAEIHKLVEDLQLAGDASLRPYGARLTYTVQPVENPASIAAELTARFAQQENHDLDRVHGVIQHAETGACRTAQLLAYFGEEITEQCGHCGNCLATEPMSQPLPAARRREMSMADVELLQSVMAEKQVALRSPRSLARFLCGISSPAASRAKLTKHDAFGALADVPFQRVLDQISSLTGWEDG